MSLFQFVRAYNFDRPETKILCDLVYRSTKYKLEPAVVTFGTPMELDPRPDVEDDPNTYTPAVVKSNFDHRLKPEETGFLYTRIPLGMLAMKDNTIIQPLAIPFKTYDILPQINKQLGTRLTEDDLENITYVTMDDDFVIQAKPTSRVWVGGRTVEVLGGGKKYLLYPNYMLDGWLLPTAVPADKKVGLTILANRDNRTGWVQGVDFEFGNVEFNLIGAVGRNTRIFIKSLKAKYVDQWLYFIRVAPSTINDRFVGTTVPKIIIPREDTTAHGLLALINAALGLNLGVDDIEDTAFPFDPKQKQFPIKFKKNSLGWLPGVYMLNVEPEELKMQNVRLVGDGTYRLVSDDAFRMYEAVAE
jgi:hypothetical protein